MGIIAKQSIKGTVVTYIGVAIGFITTFIVMTRFLTTEEVGLVRVMIDAATLFVGLAQLGTSSSLIRFAPWFRQSSDIKHQTPNTSNGFWFWAVVVPFIGFLVFAIIYWACKVPITQWFEDKSPLFVDYYYFVLPIAFFLLYQTVFETCSNVLMRIVVPRAVREIGIRVGLLALYLLYAFRIISMDGFIIALSGVYALATLINLGYVLATEHIRFKPDWAFLKANTKLVRDYSLYTGFLIISAVTSVLAPSLSSFFVTAQMGLNYTGIFAIATYMAVMVSIPYRSVTAIAAPQLADAIQKGRLSEANTLTKQVVNNTFLIGAIIFLVIWINIDLIYAVLPNGETYSAARTCVFILMLSQLIMATFSITLNTISYGRYYALSLVLSAILTAVAIIANNLLIPRFGMNGAAMSNLISYGLYMVLALIVVMGCMKINPLSRKMLTTLGLTLVVLGLNHSLWYEFNLHQTNVLISSLVRDCLLIPYLFVIYKFQVSDEINALLRSIFIPRH